VLNDALAQAQPLVIPPSVPAPAALTLDCSVDSQAAASAVRAAANDAVRAASWSITSATAEARHITRVTRAVDAAADDPTRVVGTDTPAHRADAGMAWGTLMHGLLEHAMRHPTATRDDLRRLAMWLTVEEPQLRPMIEEALDTVARVANAEFWRLAQDGARSVETPFAVLEAGHRLANGVVDLLFQSEAGWHIVDYKTDLALDATSYQAQLDAYRNALRKFDCKVVEAEIVSVRARRQSE
jgi:ATP-dependent exoDNAse (exonuclease V) beta subunit